jgi:hypothetical protein
MADHLTHGSVPPLNNPNNANNLNNTNNPNSANNHNLEENLEESKPWSIMSRPGKNFLAWREEDRQESRNLREQDRQERQQDRQEFRDERNRILIAQAVQLSMILAAFY